MIKKVMRRMSLSQVPTYLFRSLSNTDDKLNSNVVLFPLYLILKRIINNKERKVIRLLL